MVLLMACRPPILSLGTPMFYPLLVVTMILITDSELTLRLLTNVPLGRMLLIGIFVILPMTMVRLLRTLRSTRLFLAVRRLDE